MARRRIVLLFLLLFFMSLTCPCGFATAVDPVPKLGEIPLPKDFNFAVTDVCCGHTYFMQAAADETGCFAIYTRHINPNNRDDIDLKKVYIDIYQADGTFLQELSFTTALDLAFELDADTVNIYFYNFVVIYKRATQELLCYAIPDGSAVNNGLYSQLRSKEFSVGNYVYSCKKGLDGYTKLFRINGGQTEILVEMVGTFDSIWLIAFPGCISSVIIILVVLWLYKKKNTEKI